MMYLKTNYSEKVYVKFSKLDKNYELYHQDNWDEELITCGTLTHVLGFFNNNCKNI